MQIVRPAMARTSIYRLAQTAVLLLLVSMIGFGPLHLAPAGPAAERRIGALDIFLLNRPALLGAITILLLVAACAFGPLLIPYGPFFIALHRRFETPLAGPALVRLTPKIFS